MSVSFLPRANNLNPHPTSLAETIQSPETKSPWRAPNPVFISDDATANVLAAETFGIEEWHYLFAV